MNDNLPPTLTGDPSFIAPGFDNPPKNPLHLFSKWLHAAAQYGISEPYGFVLSTVKQSQSANSRVVLLTEFDNAGFTFGTSSHSAKGKEFQNNPSVAGNFWWRETMQQIRFQGEIRQLDDATSDKMFQARAREAQAATVAAHPSAVLQDAFALKERAKEILQQKIITRPETWHGYHIKASTMEFWHGSPDRLHKRLQYSLQGDKWNWRWLQP